MNSSAVNNEKIPYSTPIRVISSGAAVLGIAVALAAIAATVLMPVSLAITVPVVVVGALLIAAGSAGWIATLIKVKKAVLPPPAQSDRDLPPLIAHVPPGSATNIGQLTQKEPSTKIVESTRLTEDQLEALRNYKREKKTTLERYSEPKVIAKETTGLPRSILVVPKMDGQELQVYALLKRKNGLETNKIGRIGEGGQVFVTLALNIDTLEQKAYLSLKSSFANKALHPGSIAIHTANLESEMKAVMKFRDSSYVTGGVAVKYRFKKFYSPMFKYGYLLDYCEGGNLADKIRKESVQLSTPVKTQIALDAAKGLLELHKAKASDGSLEPYVHRDVKPENIVLYQKGGEIRAKLCDLGYAVPVTQSNSYCGSPGYMDPYIKFNTEENLNFDTRSDVWAFGATLYELAILTLNCGESMGYAFPRTFYPNLDGLGPEPSLKRWKNRYLFNQAENPFREIIDNCLQYEPGKRWSMDQVVEALSKLAPQEVRYPSAADAACVD